MDRDRTRGRHRHGLTEAVTESGSVTGRFDCRRESRGIF